MSWWGPLWNQLGTCRRLRPRIWWSSDEGKDPSILAPTHGTWLWCPRPRRCTNEGHRHGLYDCRTFNLQTKSVVIIRMWTITYEYMGFVELSLKKRTSLTKSVSDCGRESVHGNNASDPATPSTCTWGSEMETTWLKSTSLQLSEKNAEQLSALLLHQRKGQLHNASCIH